MSRRSESIGVDRVVQTRYCDDRAELFVARRTDATVFTGDERTVCYRFHANDDVALPVAAACGLGADDDCNNAAVVRTTECVCVCASTVDRNLLLAMFSYGFMTRRQFNNQY